MSCVRSCVYKMLKKFLCLFVLISVIAFISELPSAECSPDDSTALGEAATKPLAAAEDGDSTDAIGASTDANGDSTNADGDSIDLDTIISILAHLLLTLLGEGNRN
ncbi:uncharacterized protein LOC128858790 [Anastrepha ludens]|uniref:uncharacterized protein LOC128858790 n=1 Tax=Anastrepha ludens TaxID=28586 RepID=UPI0023B10540|nr:uncharacterized protein LOC128858790 [Anastrepha ludens]